MLAGLGEYSPGAYGLRSWTPVIGSGSGGLNCSGLLWRRCRGLCEHAHENPAPARFHRSVLVRYGGYGNLLQPVLDPSEVHDFLIGWAGGPVENISQFSNGQVSSVFSFDVVGDVPENVDPNAGNGQYVVRFVSLEHGEGLKKDRFIGPRAAAVGIPVPRLVHLGEVELSVANRSDEERLTHDSGAFPLAFAICDRMPGEHMGELQDPDRRHLIPTTVKMIDLISQIDISDTTGYGWFDGNGNAKHETWYDYLAAEAFREDANSFFGRHRKLFDEGFLEVDVLQHLSDRMMEVAGSTPAIERSVVHIDFGYDNTLVVDDRTSAVLDWDNSIIGDHLYDGARTDLYMPELDFKRLFVELFEDTGRDVPNIDERWLCCQLHVGLEALRWYGVSNNPEAYEWMKARTLNVMGEGPEVGRHPDS